MVSRHQRPWGFTEAKAKYKPRPISETTKNSCADLFGAGASSSNSLAVGGRGAKVDQPALSLGMINEGFNPLDPNEDGPWERHRVQWEGDNGENNVNAWEMVREEDR